MGLIKLVLIEPSRVGSVLVPKLSIHVSNSCPSVLQTCHPYSYYGNFWICQYLHLKPNFHKNFRIWKIKIKYLNRHEIHQNGMVTVENGWKIYGLSKFPLAKNKTKIEGQHGLSEMGVPAELGRWVTAWKGMTKLPEGLCSREGKVGDIFVLFISISRWN